MKKLLALFLASMMMLGMIAMAETTAMTEGVQADAEFYAQADLSSLAGKKLGITVQSLQNAYWSGVMAALGDCLEGLGAEYTILSCDDSSVVQGMQIENFIAQSCDLIMIPPSDASTIEDLCAVARSQGIKVMCWDDPMENTDANWIINNHDLGVSIGEMTADFINAHYSADNKAEIILIGYSTTRVLLEREEGIREGLSGKADGKFEIVATRNAIVADDAQLAVETALAAHPNAKVVAGIGAGSMIGACEALNTFTGGVIPEDMGVFTTDVTKQQLEQLADPAYPAKGIIGFEGSDADTARSCASMFALILSDKVGAKNVFRSFTPLDGETAEAIMADMK